MKWIEFYETALQFISIRFGDLKGKNEMFSIEIKRDNKFCSPENSVKIEHIFVVTKMN